jgi:hypothetical protein
VVFLSLFETDAKVRRVFCPPKELYESKPSASDPKGRVLPPFDELIESGRTVGLNFPVALNHALAKTIGTFMKIDYQRAVQLRIPTMDAHPERHFRPTVFIWDEYQNFATVGGDNPTGDERFYSVSRHARHREKGRSFPQFYSRIGFVHEFRPLDASQVQELLEKPSRTSNSFRK